jgi:hypothetical protein
MFVSIMKKKYPNILNETERDNLKNLIAAGTARARKLTHTRILLKADQSTDGPGWVDDAVAEAVEVSQPTVSRVRKQYFEEGLEAALNRRLPTTGTTTESSMGSRRRGWWHLPAASHQRARLAKVCGLWPTASSEEAVADPSKSERRVRLVHGEYARSLHPPLQPATPPDLHGRYLKATSKRYHTTPADGAGKSRASRLRG